MNYDVVVVGLGIYGSAIAREAGERGLKVLAVDKYSPPHENGSSHGGSRIFRLTTVEGEEYTELARISDQAWHEYDRDLNGALISPSGLAIISQESTASQLHHGVDNLVMRAANMTP